MKKKVVLSVICLLILVLVGYFVNMYINKNGEIIKPPVLEIYTIFFNRTKCIIGTYSWQGKLKNGKIVAVEADSGYPVEFEYKEENILNILENTKIYLESNDISIKSVKTYKLNEKEEMLSNIEIDNNEKSVTLTNISLGEYVLEINVEYPQGNVCYGVRINIVEKLPE